MLPRLIATSPHPLTPALRPVPGRRPEGRRVLHVQSISEWAPSCIGPYSQALSHNGLILMAGQIALDPPTMAMVGAGLDAQCLRALHSCQVGIAGRGSPRFRLGASAPCVEGAEGALWLLAGAGAVWLSVSPGAPGLLV